MPARKKIFHDENTRLKIQATQLINRLQNHIFAKPSDENYEDKHLTPQQVQAATRLLDKILPNLNAIDIVAQMEERRYISAEPMSPDEWEEKYSLGAPRGASESLN